VRLSGDQATAVTLDGQDEQPDAARLSPRHSLPAIDHAA
jgi:hypothetical protein